TLLLPVLHAIQKRIGWVSPGAINYVAQRLDVPPAEIHGVASFYHMFSLTPQAPVVAYICEDVACLAKVSEQVCEELEKRRDSLSSGATWHHAPCWGLCERAPAALITAAGERPWERVLAPVTAEDLVSTVDEAAAGRIPPEPDTLRTEISVPQAGQPELRLLR